MYLIFRSFLTILKKKGRIRSIPTSLGVPALLSICQLILPTFLILKLGQANSMRIFPNSTEDKSENKVKKSKSIRHPMSGSQAAPAQVPLKTVVYFEGDSFAQLLISKNISLAKTRLDSVNDMNAVVDIFGNTALHVAVSMRDIPFIILLLQKGSDFDACNNSGKTPWDIAIALKDTDILGLLLLFNSEAHTISNDNPDLLLAAENTRGRFIYQKICLLNTIENSTSLGHFEEVTIKLQNREALEVKDKNGVSLLMRACHKGHYSIVKKMLEWGAKTEVKDKSGWSCLSYAVFGGHLEIVKYLIDIKKMPHTGLDLVSEPIVIAAYQGFYHMLSWFQDTFEILAKSKFVSKCLMMAVWMGHTSIVQYLKSRKISSGDTGNWIARGCNYVDKFNEHYSLLDGFKKPYKSTWIQQMETLVNENNDGWVKRPSVLLSYKANSTQKSDGEPSPMRAPCGNLFRINFSNMPELEAVKNDVFELKSVVTDINEAYVDLVLQASTRITWSGTVLDEAYIRVLNKFKQTINKIDSEDRAQVIVLSTECKDVIEDVLQDVEKLLNIVKQDKTGFLYLISTTFLIKIKDACRKIDEDDLTDLLKKTKLVSGVWPPPTAKQEFLASLCNMMLDFGSLIQLLNSTGLYNMYILTFQHQLQKTSSNYNVNVTDVDYKDYKQKQYQQIQQDVNAATTNAVVEEEVDPFQQRLEYLIIPFITAIKHMAMVTNKFDTAPKVNTAAAGPAPSSITSVTTISNASSAVHNASDAIVDEILQLELFHNENGNTAETQLIRLTILQHTQTAMGLANDVIKYAVLLSGKWPPTDAKEQLLYSLAPLVEEIKLLIEIAKQGAIDIRKYEKDVLDKLGNWQKSILQTQRMSKIFQFWDSNQNGTPQLQTTAEDYWDTILDDKTQIQKDGIVITDGVVKGGRLTKIVEYLTHPLKQDESFMIDFFVSLRTFTAPIEILDLLLIKYNTQPPFGFTESQFMAYMKRHVAPMRLKLTTIIKFWIVKYWKEDFEQDEVMQTKLKQIISKIAKDYVKQGKQLQELMDATDKDPPLPEVAAVEMPKSLVTKKFNLSYLLSDVRVLLELDPIEVARQIVLIEYSLFFKIRPRETINQIYADTNGTEMALYPNMHKMIAFTNQITMWVCSTMVSIADIKTRVLVLKYFMSVAIALREIQNFNALTAIVAGLTMGPVFRLKKTLAKMVKTYPKIHAQYLETVAIVSPKGQYVNYRKHLKTLQKPILPFLGIIITDMTFVELGNNNYLPDNHFINFDKRRKFSGLIKDMGEYQKLGFNFTPILFIQEYLYAVKPEQNENKLFENSQQVEPPEMEVDDDE